MPAPRPTKKKRVPASRVGVKQPSKTTRPRRAPVRKTQAVSKGLLHLCLKLCSLFYGLTESFFFFNRRPSVNSKKNRVHEKASISFLLSLHLIIIFSVLKRSPTGWLQIRPCVFLGAYLFTKPYSIIAHIRKLSCRPDALYQKHSHLRIFYHTYMSSVHIIHWISNRIKTELAHFMYLAH